VNGQQYVWRYTYAQNCNNAPLNSPYSYEEMVVPVDTTVTLDLRAQDVIHSWWIPKLGGKQDATPGYKNYTWFKIPGKFGQKPGGTLFYGQCAEFCGRGHANMTARVRAVSVQEYQAWIAKQRADIRAANLAAEAQRKALANSAGNSSPGGNDANAGPGENPSSESGASPNSVNSQSPQ